MIVIVAKIGTAATRRHGRDRRGVNETCRSVTLVWTVRRFLCKCSDFSNAGQPEITDTMVPVIRKATTEDMLAVAEVQIRTWRSTYRGIISDEYLAGLSGVERAAVWASFVNPPGHLRSHLLVAEDESRIIGFAAAGPARDADPALVAELYALYVLESHQGSGTGRCLVNAVHELLRDAGFAVCTVRVLASNPYARFYGRSGACFDSVGEVLLGGESHVVHYYRWNLNDLSCHSARQRSGSADGPSTAVSGDVSPVER